MYIGEAELVNCGHFISCHEPVRSTFQEEAFMRALVMFFVLAIAASVASAQWAEGESMLARKTAFEARLNIPPALLASQGQIVYPAARFILKPDNNGKLNFDTSLARRFQRAIDSVGDKYGVRGMSAAVLIPEKGIWLGTYGYSTTAPDSIRPETVFNITSQTKTFTSVLLLKLIEEGKLALDDSIGRYLTNLPSGISGRITIRQLLNMTSGVYDFINDNTATWRNALLADISRNWSPEEILASFALPQSMPPGSSWWYSSTNTILAGMIARNVSQKSISMQLHQRILTPLSMTHTYFPPEDTLVGPIVHPWRNGVDVSSWYGNSMHSTLWTAGAIYSTAEDMVRWVNALYSGQLLTPTSLAQMQTCVPEPPEWILSGGGISEEAYGLGTIRYTFLGKPLWGHTGSLYGYASMGTYHPENGVSVALLSNWRVETGSLMRIHVFESVSALYHEALRALAQKNGSPYIVTNTLLSQLPLIGAPLPTYENAFQVTNEGGGVDSIYITLDAGNTPDSAVTISPKAFRLPAGSSQLITLKIRPLLLTEGTIYNVVVKVDSRFSVAETHFEKTFNFSTISKPSIVVNTSSVVLSKLSADSSRIDTSFYVKNQGYGFDSLSISFNATPNPPVVSAVSVSPVMFRLASGDSQAVTFSIRPGSVVTNTNYSASVFIDSRFGAGQTHFEKKYLFRVVTTSLDDRPTFPNEYALEQNYPNPFNPNSEIRYHLPALTNSERQAGMSEFRHVRLAVYDLLGREVAVLVNESKAPGTYQVTFDASGLASGVYLYRMSAGSYVTTHKMLVMK
jgi:D-alanyl-D-alanine carboxypeptidase